MRDIDYALEWYKYGLDKNDDAIVKFMMHWIAFNWLYSAYGDRRETNNIKRFAKTIMIVSPTMMHFRIRQLRYL